MKSDLTPKQLNSVLQSQHYKRQLAVFFYRAELYNFVHPVATLLGAPVLSVFVIFSCLQGGQNITDIFQYNAVLHYIEICL